MAKRVLLGMLTPSSNTVLEPVTSAMVSSLPEVSAHFGRFRVTEISLQQQALQQFDNKPLIDAAQLLADAKVDAIAWNGTSAGWLGFEADVQLCQQITDVTGIPATTSVLALLEILRDCAKRSAQSDRQITKFGLVTPYLPDVQERIIVNFAEAGFHCIAEQHLNLSVNFTFSEVTPDKLTSMIHSVAAQQPQAILTFCTNLRAAPLVAELEKELGIPIYDTVTAAVWKSLCIAGVDSSRIEGWGSLFSHSFGKE
ncbi:maleate cis-trans isomerase family protein [Gloeocapsopsis dulcis]|uniref:Asp/Glu/hydantoin racemase n=1 Tax=Gloeocapsopsis dulcis AAB1 = 1H9 TaxID=1433147 RepID=A0A6N8FVN0_9CHRO|nr:aspartate/glutamate racemase family protein [Gloeocapsopsis dulcis]MUL36217.1 Asp/Glu/hydantoin racemase [Gloeocapsopsis dulcis AAB1 = 1H9]WNN89672.1 aspartate/glutamate racemase family protein [Gloeocapsopsis dulcis]